MKPINILNHIHNEVVKPARNLTEAEIANDDIQVYMNTWKNYNEYGADLEQYGIKSIADGWMTPEEAKEFAEKYEEDEPFINDIDNCPVEDVNEYSSLSILDDFIDYNNLGSDDREVVSAILESGYTSDISEAISKANSGDYIYFPGVSNAAELGEANIEMIGGIIEAVGKDNIENYFDEKSYKEEIEADMREYIAQENGYDSIDDVSDEELETYIDSLVDDEIANAAASGNSDFFEAHFDYEAWGRALEDDGYSYTDNGAILVL